MVHEDLLRVAQMDLRDALVRFCDVNRPALDDITASILWRSATIDPPRPCEELAQGMEALSDALAGILAHPEHRATLSSRGAPPTPPIHMPAILAPDLAGASSVA